MRFINVTDNYLFKYFCILYEICACIKYAAASVYVNIKLYQYNHDSRVLVAMLVKFENMSRNIKYFAL
jgi:hypothetical protein